MEDGRWMRYGLFMEDALVPPPNRAADPPTPSASPPPHHTQSRYQRKCMSSTQRLLCRGRSTVTGLPSLDRMMDRFSANPSLSSSSFCLPSPAFSAKAAFG